ncbi:PAS domain-containing sensor histidine kinase [Halobacteriales archaeon QS_1_68_17]|nr:MAG: PAS domain-containing sensor histidine kinase [Halobacteriales archaeon QS_1_68_17]
MEEGQAGDGTGATTDPPAWVRDRLRTLEAVLDAIPDLVIVYDADGEYREVLTDQQVLTFRSPTELVGRTVHEVLDAETADLICDAIERTLSTGDVETVEYRVDLAGESFWFEGLLSSIEREAEDRVVFVARDVTRRKRRERDLRRQNQRLDEFASVVSHDLRNPLQVAEGHLELAREECDSERLDDVERAHDRMRQLIDDVLSLARQGETVDDPGPVSIPDVVADARAHSAVEDVVVADGLPEVRADAERLTALFENLFRNSVEHGATADGGPTVRVGPIDGGFYVADDGPGIPADQREAVFEPGNSEGEGTGFGLAIVRRIAEAHGWSVRATESESGGARFEFTGVETA